MEKSKSIFDFLNDICYHKTKWEDIPEQDRRKFQPYMILRWLSMDIRYLPIVADVQPIASTLSSREFYVFFTNLLPKRKFFTSYIKSSPKEQKLERLTTLIADKLQMSVSDAEALISFSDKDTISDWLRGYGYDDVTIKKMFI